MDAIACRLLPYAVADGPRNMACDEVLLEGAMRGIAALRFYGWSPATLSLGYFQSEKAHRSDPCLAALPYVRRPSGGATLVHHHELTYALALPAGPPWQPGKTQALSWLGRMHRIIAAGLGSLGVAVDMFQGGDRQPAGNVLCFRHVTPGDLMIGTAKVVGSAQRRQRGAVMQHGGILLAASPHAAVLPGIRELTGILLDACEVSHAIVREIMREIGWRLVEEDWTSSERFRINELVHKKYTQLTWNGKR